jgi:mono/diheme cytochrome c family protein
MNKKKPSFLRRLFRLAVLVAVAGLLVMAWYATRPGPMAFAGGRAIVLDAYKAGHPNGTPADLKASDPLARGRYLTEAADCQACHTAEGGQPFAGGLAFKTSFGTLYSPNITADKETGIGGWSDADFLGAVHEGIDDEGARLYPAMPYAAYSYLTDDDVLAIKAYLFSLPPVKNETPEDRLSFPYNQRWLMAFWSALFNPKHRFMPVVERSPEWNRGAYLVEGLAHCGECHTPRNLLQGLDNANKFAGGAAEGWSAYNITQDAVTGVGSWSEAQLVKYLSSGHAEGRGAVAGPMAQAVELSFSNLTASDIHAIVTYLRSVPAIASSTLPAAKEEPAPANPKQGVAAQLDPHGKQVYEGACASCHGWTGESLLAARATLTGSRTVNDPTATNVALIVLSGSKFTPNNGTIAMPAFGAAYSDREIAAVSNYVTARFGAKASAITAEDVRKMRATQ